MHCVDGYIVPVAKKNLPAYRRANKKMGKIWREYGALDLRECVAEDVKVLIASAGKRVRDSAPTSARTED